MVLYYPFPVYGTITDAGAPVNNANVYVRNFTVPGATETMTTAADGKYIIDMMAIGTDGHDYYVWAFAPDGKYKKDSFELITTDQSQLMNLALENYPLADTPPAPVDALVKTFSTVIADTPPVPVDAPTLQVSIVKADTVPVPTDSYAMNFGKVLADTPPAPTDAYIMTFSKVIADTPPLLSESNTLSFSKVLTDIVPVPVDDTIKTFSKVLSDVVPVPVDAESHQSLQSPFTLKGYSTNEEAHKGCSTNEETHKMYSKNEQIFNIKKEE